MTESASGEGGVGETLELEVVADADADEIKDMVGNRAHEGIALTVDGSDGNGAHARDAVKGKKLFGLGVVDLDDEGFIANWVDDDCGSDHGADGADDVARQGDDRGVALLIDLSD